MPLTVVTDVAVKQAGNVKILFGPKITNLASPSLAAFTVDGTCPIREFNHDVEVSFTEDQSLCQLDATTQLDKRTQKLGPIRFRVNAANRDALKALHAPTADIGVFLRPFTPSATAAAVADKGLAWNAKVAKFVLNPIAIGNEYEVTAEYYAVTHDDNATLAA